MVVTYYIKLFRTGIDRHHGILMMLLFLVAETKMLQVKHFSLCVCVRARARVCVCVCVYLNEIVTQSQAKSFFH